MTQTTLLPPLSEMPLGAVARIAGADLAPRWAEARFGTISTDSRAVGPGEFFLALRGEKFDGHRYCQMAAERGAAGLIIARDAEDKGAPGEIPGETLPILRVDDTLEAYGRIARERRMRWAGPAIAISGSVGKTTTRRMIAAALSRGRRVLEPVRNFNNLVGLPHTLLRLEAAHEVAVLELGMNQPGELARLAQIALPSAALLTRIADSHVGMFTSFADLVRAKLDLFRGTPAGAPLVVNAACPHSMAAIPEFRDMHPILKFDGGLENGRNAHADARVDVRIENIRALPQIGYAFDLNVQGQKIAGCELRHFGRHQLENVAAAAAGLLALGEPVEWLAESLADFRGESLRGEIVEAGGMTLILDCYNASPWGMRSALQSLAEMPAAGRRIVVLADMLELGARADDAHGELLPLIEATKPDAFFGLGPQCSRLAEKLAARGVNARGFAQRDTLIEALRSEAKPGDQLFFKGSHSFGLESAAAAVAPEAEIAKHGD